MPTKPLIVLTVIITTFYTIYSTHLKGVLKEKSYGLHSLSYKEVVPDFTLETLNGDEVRLQTIAAENQLVLVNFWATWCGPCRIEMTQFAKFHEKYSDKGLYILAINVAEDEAAIVKYLDEHPLPFTILLDPEGRVAEAYGIRAYPTNLLVDTDRRLQWRAEGLSPALQWNLTSRLDQKWAPNRQSK